MLKKREEGRGSYGQVLEEAQRRGYAEPDPTSDVQGLDALSKMKVLGTMFGGYDSADVFGVGNEKIGFPSRIRRMITTNDNLGIEGITDIMLRELAATGNTIRLVGTYDASTRRIEVGPKVVGHSDPLAS